MCRVDHQTEIGVAREDNTVDWGRYNQIGIDLFGLLEHSNLMVTGSKQFQFFESRSHMRFMRGMRGGDFLFFLFAGCSESNEILRAFEFLVFGVKLREGDIVLSPARTDRSARFIAGSLLPRWSRSRCSRAVFSRERRIVPIQADLDGAGGGNRAMKSH